MPITIGRTAIGWSILQRDQVPTFEVQLSGGVAKLYIRPGDTATILCDLIKRYDATVEPVIGPVLDYWTFALRMVRESDRIWSEHSAGTALDIRALLHPRGRRGTFTDAQVAAIHDLLDFYEGVVDWGGNFKTTVDEMHFEIGAKPGDPAIARVAAKIRALEDNMPTADEIADEVIYKLIHSQYTGDEGGVQLDKRSIAGVSLVGARASLALLTAVANVSKQVQLVAVAVADDATKAQVQELGDKVDQLLAEVTPPGEPAPPASNS
jgi:hypothetical protein